MIMEDNESNLKEDEELLAKAIEESLKENPNPDMMNYEQLQELGDKIGHVSKGLTMAEIGRIREFTF